MRPKPPDYVAIERVKWLSASKNVSADDDRVRKAASAFADRFDYKLNSVIEKISVDRMFAAWFAKTPSKTGLHESIAGAWIKDLPNVSSFCHLPKGGINSVKIDSDGNLRGGTEPGVPGKSLDFSWVSSRQKYYAMHKYTKESGGSQDNQFLEMRDLLVRFQPSVVAEFTLVVIVDGEYYQRNDCAKIKILSQYERKTAPISKALTIGDLPMFLESMSTKKPT